MDRVGIGWRTELSAGIICHRGEIDFVEVIADDYYRYSKRKLGVLRLLADQVPVVLHGVGMGVASTHPVDVKRVEDMARLLDFVRPEFFSEHLAFVRAGQIEIGHLAQPPRNEMTVAGTLRNLRTVRGIIGCLPALENIATLVDPPASSLSEPAWITEIIAASGAPLLLDLHNLYANALNFKQNPFEMLQQFPLQRVSTVHISGGHWIPEPAQPDPFRQRLLDDHVHDVPEIVFQLLKELASLVVQPLAVVIERDGRYPPFQILLDQIRMAKTALADGRKIAMARKACA